MPDYGAIAGFGQGALQGYDAGLSNYAQAAELWRRKQAEERQQRTETLQGILHGVTLASTAPEAASALMANPAYTNMLPEGTQPIMGAAVARAHSLQEAERKINQSIMTGNIDESMLNDPMVGHALSNNKNLQGPFFEAVKLHRLQVLMMSDASIEDKAKALLYSGTKVDMGLLDRAYPGLAAEMKRQESFATTQGGIQGELTLGPGGRALGEERAANRTYGEARGRMQVAPGTNSPIAEILARLEAGGRKAGEINAELAPQTPAQKAIPVGQTLRGRSALESETPAKRAELEARTLKLSEDTTREDEKRKLKINKLQTQGYYYDPETKREWRPEDIRQLTDKRTVKAPKSVRFGNEDIPVFQPTRPTADVGDDSDMYKFLDAQKKLWVGRKAVVGVNTDGSLIIRPVTLQEFATRYDPIVREWRTTRNAK